jgi:hypothetical protein
MMPSEETNGTALPSSHGPAARIRVHRVGEVTKHGPCWRLTYTYCEHTQEFALAGLEDPERLLRFVLRYFTDCLTCDVMVRQAGAVDEQAANRRATSFVGADFPSMGN